MEYATYSSIATMREVTSPQQFTPPFPPLEQVTKPNLTTRELAYYTNSAEQTWRVHACHGTYPDGMRPLRIGNKLNWPTIGVKKLVGVQA